MTAVISVSLTLIQTQAYIELVQVNYLNFQVIYLNLFKSVHCETTDTAERQLIGGNQALVG